MSKSNPEQILIVGAGEFGLATALALLKRPAYQNSHITILDSSPTLPNPSGSSVDTNRIIRADYASKPYAILASQAQHLWRDQSDSGWGGQGRYAESGFILTADKGADSYMKASLANVQSITAQDGTKIELLPDQQSLQRASGYEGVSGDSGYVNWNSGWAHAEKVVEFALKKLRDEGKNRVTVRSNAKVEELIIENDVCRGAIVNGEKMLADLTIVAAGAWTPSLIDLEGVCLATGQVMAYIDLTPEEQAQIGKRPVIMNMSRGTFIIPPQDGQLKVARHGFGYINPVPIKDKAVSVPQVGVPIPPEGDQVCRQALRELLPQMGDRPFVRTRICWYCDTSSGDFLIDHHPQYSSLVVATGGSGHGFKFFPVIGEKIADLVEHKLEAEYKSLWQWRDATSEFMGCNDGSRSGRKGMILEDENQKQV